MPRPFPFPLNIGTDICSIPRILKILKGANGRKFTRRVLSEREREEGIERLDGPIERWRAAGRIKSGLQWKRKELEIGIKELARRKASGKGGGLSRMGSVKEREELRRVLEREIRAEESVARMREEWREGEKVGVGVVDEDSALISGRELTDMELDGQLEEGVDSKDEVEDIELGHHEKLHEVVAAEDEVEAIGNEGPADLKQKRLDNVDIMIRLMEENQKESKAAEEALKKAAEFMAGRFAAKEAAIKAHHNRKLTYHSIAIHRPPNTDPEKGSQPPIAVILPETGEWEEGQEVKISISHDADYATAVCMAFDPNRRGDSEPRRIGHSPYSTSEISETNRDIFEELEIDDMESKAEDDESAWNLPTTALAEKEEAHDPRRLVKVENLAEDATAEHLLEIFKGSSEKLKVYIAVNSDGKRRGYALLSFGTSNEAVIARGKVDRMVLKGEKITCRWMGSKKAGTRGLGIGGKRVLRGIDPAQWVEAVKPGQV